MAYAGGPQQPTFNSRDTTKDLLDDWVSILDLSNVSESHFVDFKLQPKISIVIKRVLNIFKR